MSLFTENSWKFSKFAGSWTQKMKREKNNWFDNVNQGNKENTRGKYPDTREESRDSRKQSAQLKMGKRFV